MCRLKKLLKTLLKTPHESQRSDPWSNLERVLCTSPKVEAPPTLLDIYIGDLSFPGWETFPTYIWKPSPVSPTPKLPEDDGGRQAMLHEYRLTSFFRKVFKRGQRLIYIDAYDFQTADGAYGAYDYLRRGSTTVLTRGDASSEDDSSISIVQGKTFLSIYGTSEDDDESKGSLDQDCQYGCPAHEG